MKDNQAFQYDFDNFERVGYLIACFIKGTLTPLERKELDEWILSSDKNEMLFNELTSEENVQGTMQWYSTLNEEGAGERVKSRISFKRERKKITLFARLAIAASFILIVGTAAIYFLTQKSRTTNKDLPVAANSDVLPGSNKAVLTLADGKKLVLDNTAPTSLDQGKVLISEGTIFYNTEAVSEARENILSIPRGGQYKIVLPDGTRVWLNAESSLTYPTAFTANERKVTLTGEGYFEVTKNKEKPFIVGSGENQIKVLGTQFNVNGYGDEGDFITTLVEGSVLISNANTLTKLKPGEQVRVNGGKMVVAQVDTKEATAWKDGEFLFRNSPVRAIVKQLARWYDLDVEYRDPVESHLNATIKRDVPLSKILHYLEETGAVHFKTEGRKLIVLK